MKKLWTGLKNAISGVRKCTSHDVKRLKTGDWEKSAAFIQSRVLEGYLIDFEESYVSDSNVGPFWLRKMGIRLFDGWFYATYIVVMRRKSIKLK